VIVIPTHMPMVRKDNPDVIYRTLPEKWDAVVEEIKGLHEKGQPVLGRHGLSRKLRMIARRLQRVGVPHNVLNAKYHEREAEIVAQGRTQRHGNDSRRTWPAAARTFCSAAIPIS
jgi:preprotein translocase subunit SecA